MGLAHIRVRQNKAPFSMASGCSNGSLHALQETVDDGSWLGDHGRYLHATKRADRTASRPGTLQGRHSTQPWVVINNHPDYAMQFSNIGELIESVMVTHSGPSLDKYYNRISLEEVQTRGRWRSTDSVRRYEKKGKCCRGCGPLCQVQRSSIACKPLDCWKAISPDKCQPATVHLSAVKSWLLLHRAL